MKTRGRAYRFAQQYREWFVPAASLQFSGTAEIGRIEGCSLYAGILHRKWPNLKRMNRNRGNKQPVMKVYYVLGEEGCIYGQSR
ncbi:MAG TPA: hypothetical protein DHU81_16415 [Hyphomonas sp.]|nr:hypothetical protein [Hyphomonas sp.]